MVAPNKNALLVGTYCSLNKGDRLMQEVVIDALTASGEFGSITLATPFPETDASCYPGVRKVRARRRNLPLSLLRILVLLVLPGPARKGLRRFDEEAAAYVEADIVIDLSGDMLTEDYGVLVGLSHAFPLWLAVLFDRPLYVIGQSIGPFKRLERLYRYLLGRARVITARDAPTLATLQQMGLDNCRLTADLAFLAQPQSPAASIEALEPDAGDAARLVGICLSSLLIGRFGSLRYAHYLELVRALLTWSQTRGVKLVFISHVENLKPEFADTQLYRRLEADLGRKLDIVGESLGPKEIKWIIAQLTCLVSLRMHPCIAALDTCTPVIGVSYSHKTVGLFTLAGAGDWVIDLRTLDADTLIERLAMLLARREEIAAMLEESVPGLRAAAQANIDCLLEGATT